MHDDCPPKLISSPHLHAAWPALLALAGLLSPGCSGSEVSGSTQASDPCALVANGALPEGSCTSEGKTCTFGEDSCGGFVTCSAGQWVVKSSCDSKPPPPPTLIPDCTELWDGNAASTRFSLFGASGYIKGSAISADEKGQVIAAGVLLGQEFRLGTAFTQTPNAYVYRERLDANEMFVINQNANGSSYPMHIAAAPDGGFVISGVFTGTVDFGSGPHTAAPGNGGVFLARFNELGQSIWSRAFDGGFSGYPGGMALDPQTGNTIFAATFEKSINFGGGPISSSGMEDIVVAKLDPDGQILWQKVFGGMGNTTDWVRDIALDSSGNIFLTGLYEWGLNFGGSALPNAESTLRTYVAKLNGQGQHIWSMACTGNSDMQGGSHIAVDSTGKVAVSGWFNGDIDCGGLQLLGLSSDNPFIMMLDANGKPSHLELVSLGGASQEGPDLAFDIQNNVLVAGTLFAKLELPGSNLQSFGSSDAFFAKLGPELQFLSGMRSGDKSAQGALALTAINDGNAAITGFTRGFFCPNELDFPESTGLSNEQGFILEMLP